jgi:hypothetical protein
MKKYILLTLLALSLIGCPGSNPQDTKDAQPDVSIDPIPTSTLIEGETWAVTLPPIWVKEISQGKSIELIASNPTTEGIAILVKEPYSGTFYQYAIEAIRGFRNQGAEILSTQSVVFNDNLFVQVESSQGDVSVMTLLSVKNDFGYALDCGGPDENLLKFKEDCQKIFSSFYLR